jgi:hypothetical protein
MPESPDRPHRTGQVALDFIIASCAIVISLASLWIALRSDQTQEQLLRSSVWPYVEYDTSNATEQGGKRLAFELRNVGVGPAIIRSFALGYKGHFYQTKDELFAACCKLTPREHVFSSTVQSRVMMAHETIEFLTIAPDQIDARAYKAIAAAQSYITARFCYCSVLGDCWYLDSGTQGTPMAVKKCPPAQMPQYLT